MPVPTVITDLSTTAASNYPAGTDSPSTLDDVQRAHASFIRALYNGDTTLYMPAGTGAVATTVQAQFRALPLLASNFGVVGDGTTDDYAAFVKACVAAVAAKRPLDISNLQIYLSSQSASINTNGLVIIGNGQVKHTNLPVNWLLETGTLAQFSIVKAQLMALGGSAIYSQYNGPIFTGKQFSGNDFTVMGYPGSANSSAFKQSTPTAYPGWSVPFENLARVTCCFFGTHGLWALGGSELYDLADVVVSQCNGNGLYVQQTTGVNSPVEYFNVVRGSYDNCLLNNIRLEGVAKSVYVKGASLNSPGQLGRRAADGFVIASESDIVYPVAVYGISTTLLPATQNVGVIDCWAESTQAIAQFRGAIDAAYAPFVNVIVEGNYIVQQNAAWVFYHAAFKDVGFTHIQTQNNTSPLGAAFWFVTSANHNSLDIGELSNSNIVTTIGNYAPTETQLWSKRGRGLTSGSIVGGANNGAGSTAYTYNLATNVAFPALGSNTGACFVSLLLTANFQSAGSDAIGGYMMHAAKMPSGNYVAIVTALGTVTGFASAPTISTAGVITMTLSQYYQGRIVRIDNAPLVNF